MVHHPPGPVVEGPAEAPPAFDDAQMVRDFFHYLLVGLEGDVPESSRVTCFRETAALGLECCRRSGVLVLVPAVMPLMDAIPMSKFLLMKKNSRAEWDVLNLDHLLAAAELASSLLQTGKALRNLRGLLKSAKGMGPAPAVQDDVDHLHAKLAVTCSMVDGVTLKAMEAASPLDVMPEMRRDTMAAMDVVNDATATVRKAVASGAVLEAKPLHKLIKKAYYDVMLLLKATEFDLPYANPFDV